MMLDCETLQALLSGLDHEFHVIKPFNYRRRTFLFFFQIKLKLILITKNKSPIEGS